MTRSAALPPRWMQPEIGLPELVKIPAGPFILGDDYGPHEARPAHAVTLPDYWISRYPVTMLHYALYLAGSKHAYPGLWPQPVRWLEQGNYPVGAVRWRDALGYCTWLSEQTSHTVRLPTEAEWEKAATWDAAEGVKYIYPWGNEFDPAYANTAESLIDALTPVDAYRIVGDSPYGVSDMFGNAAEWTLARLMPYPYIDTDGRHDLNLMGYRVARGGSFQSEGRWTTAVHRQYFSPDETRYPVGFRIVVESV